VPVVLELITQVLNFIVLDVELREIINRLRRMRFTGEMEIKNENQRRNVSYI
jgi:hypothetical protein